MAKRRSKWTPPIAEAILSVEQIVGEKKARRLEIIDWLRENRPQIYNSVKRPEETIQYYLEQEEYGFVSVFGKVERKGFYTFDSNAPNAPAIQFAIQRKDKDEGLIDHHFSLLMSGDSIRARLISKGGGYNMEYHHGIVRFFSNLREKGLVVSRILWDSNTARNKPKLSRTLKLSWPDDLDELGGEGFRKMIGGQIRDLGGGYQASILIEIETPDSNLTMLDAVQLLGGQIRFSEKSSIQDRMQDFESNTQNRLQRLSEKIANGKATDQTITSTRREEQNDLRRVVFGTIKENPKIECSMCRRLFPNHGNYIICAHIKRREDASEEERINPLIVAPMCKFGCDALFEAGAIIVDSNGIIQTNNHVAQKSSDLLAAANELAGKQCSRFEEGNEEFFAHHRGIFSYPH